MNPRIVEYEALYRATGNPLYAWEALTECAPDEPLPRWIFDYLQGCASAPAVEAPDGIMPKLHGLLDIATLVTIGKTKPSDAVKWVARALGLQRGSNYNAFADHRMRVKDASMAFYAEGSGDKKVWGRIAKQHRTVAQPNPTRA